MTKDLYVFCHVSFMLHFFVLSSIFYLPEYAALISAYIITMS